MQNRAESRAFTTFQTYHARELSITTVCTRLVMAPKTGDLGEVETKLILKPVDSISRTASKNTDQVIAS